MPNLRTQKWRTPPCLERLVGSAKTYGIDYEYKLAGLIALRAHKKLKVYYIFNNVMQVTPWDDIVLCILDPKPKYVLFMQLKHGDSKKKVTNKNLKAIDGAFSVKKYFEAFCAYLENRKANTQNSPLIYDCDLSEVYYVMFTNRPVIHTKEDGPRKAANDFPFDYLLRTTDKSHAVFVFKDTDKEVWQLYDNFPEKTKYQKEFLSRLWIYSEQVHANMLDELIEKELNTYFSRPLPSSSQVLSDYIKSLRNWAQDDNVTSSLNYKGILETILVQNLAGRAKSAVCVGNLSFEERHHLFKKLKNDTFNKPKALRIEVRGVPPGLRFTKLFQVLEDNSAAKWVYVDDTAFRDYSQDALEYACKACEVVVVDVDRELDKAVTFIKDVLDKCRPLKIVVLSSGEDKDALDGINPSCLSIEDNWKLDHLTNSSQEEIMKSQITFQEHVLKLSDLEEAWPSLRVEVGGAMLCDLAKGKTVTIGSALPAVEVECYVSPTLNRTKDDQCGVQLLESNTAATSECNDVWKRRVGLLVGVAGAGKSVFLRGMAKNVLSEQRRHWVVYVQAFDHKVLLGELQKKQELSLDDVVDLLAAAAGGVGVALASSACAVEAARGYLRAALCTTGALSVFVDGVDEICPKYESTFLQLLCILRQHKTTRVWVSSRPQVEKQLSRALDCRSSTLRPFSKVQQIQYLTNWSKKCGTAASMFCSIREEMLQQLHSVTANNDQRCLLEVPQHLQIAAQTIQDAATTSRQEHSSQTQQVIHHKVYERIINHTKESWMKRHNIQPLVNEAVPISDDFDDINNICAMFILITLGHFENVSLKPFQDYFHKNKDKINQGNWGIIWLDENEVYYEYYALVEYCAAKWCSSPTKQECETTIAIRRRIGKGECRKKGRLELLNAVLEMGSLPGAPGDSVVAKGNMELHPVDEVMQNGEPCENRKVFDVNGSHASCVRASVPTLCTQWSSCGAAASRNGHDELAERLCTTLTIEEAAGGEEGEASTAVDGRATSTAAASQELDCALHRAARSDVNMLERLLASSGSPMQAKDARGRTLLHSAAEAGNTDAVLLLLLDIPADAGSGDLEGVTPLHLAARGGHVETAELLLDVGRADPKPADRHGRTPMWYAAHADHNEIAIVLLKAGAGIAEATARPT